MHNIKGLHYLTFKIIHKWIIEDVLYLTVGVVVSTCSLPAIALKVIHLEVAFEPSVILITSHLADHGKLFYFLRPVLNTLLM